MSHFLYPMRKLISPCLRFVHHRTHLFDVLNCLAYLRSEQDEEKWSKLLPSFRAFITLRCRFKLRSRVELFRDLWGDIPFEFLGKISGKFRTKIKRIVLETPLDPRFYTEYPTLFHPRNGRPIAVINTSNIPAWGSLFDQLWVTLRAALDTVFDATQGAFNKRGHAGNSNRGTRIPVSVNRVPSSTSNFKDAVVSLVDVMGLLRLLQPVLADILSNEIQSLPIERALLAQGMIEFLSSYLCSFSH